MYTLPLLHHTCSITNLRFLLTGQAISGAITLAVDEINVNSSILPNHLIEFLIAETYGQENGSIRFTADMPNYNISAYIGPQETCIHEGRIAAAFNLPMISYVSIPRIYVYACEFYVSF